MTEDLRLLIDKLEWLAFETGGIDRLSRLDDNGDTVMFSDAFREAAAAISTEKAKREEAEADVKVWTKAVADTIDKAASDISAERHTNRLLLDRARAAETALTALQDEASFLRLSGFLPFRIVETADYAEVHAASGDGKTAFALTMSPSFFEELNALAAALTKLETKG